MVSESLQREPLAAHSPTGSFHGRYERCLRLVLTRWTPVITTGSVASDGDGDGNGDDDGRDTSCKRDSVRRDIDSTGTDDAATPS